MRRPNWVNKCAAPILSRADPANFPHFKHGSQTTHSHIVLTCTFQNPHIPFKSLICWLGIDRPSIPKSFPLAFPVLVFFLFCVITMPELRTQHRSEEKMTTTTHSHETNNLLNMSIHRYAHEHEITYFLACLRGFLCCKKSVFMYMTETWYTVVVFEKNMRWELAVSLVSACVSRHKWAGRRLVRLGERCTWLFAIEFPSFAQI